MIETNSKPEIPEAGGALDPSEVQAFSTQDGALAFSLYMAGIPFMDPARPCTNIYTEDGLRRLGFRGMTIEEAARAAFAKAKKGTVKFYFRQVPEIGRLLRAYQAQVEEIETGEGTAAELRLNIASAFASGEMKAPEFLLRDTCIDLKMRGPFMELWKAQPPMVRIMNEGESRIRDGAPEWDPRTKSYRTPKIVTNPGFKIVALNLSAQKRAHLKV